MSGGKEYEVDCIVFATGVCVCVWGGVCARVRVRVRFRVRLVCVCACV